MAWKYKYDSLSQFIDDYQTTLGIWTEYGRIDSIQITPFTNPGNDGYVIMFAVQPGSKIRNLNRFSFSLTQFLNLYFSKEIPGINFYLSEDPNIRDVNTWDLLPPEEKTYYQNAAIRLIADNYLRVYWPIEPIISPIPIIQIKINNIVISSTSTFVLPTSPVLLNEEITVRFSIKNIGNSALYINSQPYLSSTELFSISRPLDRLYLQRDESDYIDIHFKSNELGEKNSVLNIRTNDPVTPLFTIVLSTTVVLSNAQIAPQITLTSSEDVIRDYGNNIDYLDLVIQTFKTYNDITFISIKDSLDQEIIRFNNPGASGSTKYYQWVPPQPISNDTFIYGTVSDGFNENIEFLNIKFMNRIYWGFSPSSSLTDYDINFLNNELSESPSGTYNFGSNELANVSGISTYMYFIYPSDQGIIDYILDIDNGFTYSPSSFNISEISFTNNYNYTKSYKVYRTKNKTYSGDMSWTVTLK
jgi:hypothetical protein